MSEGEGPDSNHNDRTDSQIQLSERTAQPTISSTTTGSGRNRNSAPCKFFLSKRGCAYGSECKFSHSGRPPREGSRARVCRLYLSSPSGCRYGDKCRYRHPQAGGVREEREGERGEEEEEETVREGVERVHLERGGAPSDQPVLLNLTSFPGLSSTAGHTTAGKPPTQHPAQHPPPSSSTPSPYSHTHSHSHTKKHAPSELSLGSFLTPPTTGGMVTTRPHPHVPRPQRGGSGSGAGKTAKELRQAELEQLETRFQGNHHLVEKGRERTVYRLTFAPTDPDWNFPFKTFDLEVVFPSDYPATPLSVSLPDDQGFHPAYISHGNRAVSRYLETRGGGPQGELMFRPFLHWLDRTITSVFKEAARQVITDELFAGSNTETTPPEDHTPYSTEEEEESETSDDQSDDESDEQQQLPVLQATTEKRGTEMRLTGLVMSDGVGVARCESVKVTLQCTRCRGQQDQLIKAESPSSQLCSQCQHCFSFSYRPSIFHPNSATLGFLDLQGCLPVDLILMQCETTLSCLECGRDNTTLGLNYGEHRDIWCKKCHMRLSLTVEQCRFVQHRPSTVATPTAPPTSGRRRGKKGKEEAVIQLGKPLPEFGTCAHYKKSNRWLRFPCCGKPFPCDL